MESVMTATSVQTKNELYIAGQWVSASGTDRVEMVSPSTERLVYSVPEATEAEIDTAVRAARQVFEAGAWSALTPGERATHLFRFAEELGERADALKVTLANEMGAPIGTAREVAGTVGLTQFFAAQAEKVQFEETRSGAFRPSVIDRLPVGVVAAVVPWNSPLFLLMQKVAPALLAGCPVIIKPAPETSYSAYAVAEALDAAGLPAGLVSVLPARRERAEYLVSHPGIDKISFTGSTATGRRLGVIAAGQFKRIGLELGGKSAGIVLPDADFGESMAAIVGPDPGAALAVARRMRTGTVTINTSIDFDFDAPYGGFKSSGIERELGGIEGILGFTEVRAIGL
jgi:aldehyde dehydrogenase (NAD+)